jgi:phage terminase small subunit
MSGDSDLEKQAFQPFKTCVNCYQELIGKTGKDVIEYCNTCKNYKKVVPFVVAEKLQTEITLLKKALTEKQQLIDLHDQWDKDYDMQISVNTELKKRIADTQKITLLEKGLTEKLAALEHQQWREWALTLMETEKISEERVKRWCKLCVASYSELTEEQKEQDRVWARKIIITVNEYLTKVLAGDEKHE